MQDSELDSAIEELGESFETFKESHKSEQLDQRERIEQLESRNNLPGQSASTKAIEHNGVRIHHDGDKLVYDIPSTVKVADVLKPEKKPAVSLERWLGALVAGGKSKDHEALDMVEQKQLVTTTGGVLIPVQYVSEWIDLIRKEMVLIKAGARTVPMDWKTKVHSAVVTDPSVTWHAEAGSISADNPTFAARTLTSKTAVVRCQASVELSQDSPDFGSQLARVITSALAADIDRVGLHGDGANEPQGLSGATGVNVVASVGTPTNYVEMLDGVKLLLDDNAGLDAVTRAAIMSPREWVTYEKLKTGISSDETQLERPKALQDTDFLVTGNVSTTQASPAVASTIFMGDFTNLLFGIRREASVQILQLDSYASNLLLEIVGYVRVDWLLERPNQFCNLEGVTSA